MHIEIALLIGLGLILAWLINMCVWWLHSAIRGQHKKEIGEINQFHQMEVEKLKNYIFNDTEIKGIGIQEMKKELERLRTENEYLRLDNQMIYRTLVMIQSMAQQSSKNNDWAGLMNCIDSQLSVAAGDNQSRKITVSQEPFEKDEKEENGKI